MILKIDTKGEYCCETRFLEGLQEGERYIDFISKTEMLEVIENEIDFCQKHGETNSALLQIEKEKNQS